MASIRSRIGDNVEDRYLYKAKRVDNKEWVQGVPFEIEGKTVILISDNENILRVHYLEENMWEADIYAVEVDPSTICQCTGLKDKNGELIWKNDICKYYNPEDKDGVGIIKDDYVSWIKGIIATKEMMTPLFYLRCSDEWEVIGNIFDNPELR